MKKLSILLLGLAMLALLPAASAFAAPSEKTLTIGVDQEAVGIDPNIVTAFSSHRRIDLLYNKLVRIDDNMSIVPDLAESWENPDNVTYIFHLRKGVKFHNGREMTAEDVQYSLNRVLDKTTASPGRSYIASLKSIDVVDRYTVKLTRTSPLPSLLDGLAANNLSIVAKEVVEAEKEADPKEERDRAKEALTELFSEAKSKNTHIIVERIVTDIDEIVKKVRFPDWQHTSQGERLVQKELRKTLLKYKLHTDQDLFDRAYAYIRQYY